MYISENIFIVAEINNQSKSLLVSFFLRYNFFLSYTFERGKNINNLFHVS